MIRRGFWLVTGAALGVIGYRKATRLGRMLTGQDPAPQWTKTAGQTPAVPQHPVSRQRPGETRGAPSWPALLAAGTKATVGFVRDVRAGMAEYRAKYEEQRQAGYRDQDGDDGLARDAGPEP